MKTKLATLLAISLSLFISGCIDTNERISMNKDGSGSYQFEVVLDYKDIRYLMEEEAWSNLNLSTSYDSSSTFLAFVDKDAFSTADKALMSDVTMRLSNKAETELRFTGDVPFTDIETFNRKLLNFRTAGLNFLVTPKQEFSYSNGKLTTTLLQVSEEASIDEGQQAMADLFFSGRTATVVYELGSKVKKIDCDDARITSTNTVEISVPMAKAMMDDMDRVGVFKFK